MTKLEREIRRRERRRLADLNKNSEEVFHSMVRTTVAGLIIIAGVIILLLASALRADQEAFAATLRRTRLIREEVSVMGEDREYLQVPPLPEFPSEDGEPPQAIEIKMATKAEAISEEHWESLGRWKLSAYCPERCCNGKNAHRTASGEPMVVGDTVATARLPFGTKLKIGEHIYTVTDRGVPYGQVDILHESHKAAKAFGIQFAEIYVLRQ